MHKYWHSNPKQRPTAEEIQDLTFMWFDDPTQEIIDQAFFCGCSDTKNEKFQTALDKLMVELKTCLATTPINLSYEATKTIYTYSYLASAVSLFERLIRIRPEKHIEGMRNYFAPLR
jgi:hypothetical protein